MCVFGEGRWNEVWQSLLEFYRIGVSSYMSYEEGENP